MNVVEINIGNKVFTVRTDESIEHVKNVESLINKQLNEFKDNRRYSEMEKHILSTFILCDKYLKLIKESDLAKENFKEELKFSKEKIISLYNENEESRKKIENMTIDKDKAIEDLDFLKKKENDYISSNTALEQALNDKEQKLVQTEMELEEIRKHLEEVNEKCIELSKDREQFFDEIKACDEQKNELNQRISKMLNKLNEKDKIISENDLSISKQKKTINELTQKLNLNLENNKNIDKAINNLKNENSGLAEQIKELKDKLTERDEIIAKNYKFIEELKILKEEMNKRCDRVNSDKEKYLEELLIANNEIESLKFSINEMTERLNAKQSENYQNEICIEELRKENAELVKLLDEATAADGDKDEK